MAYTVNSLCAVLKQTFGNNLKSTSLFPVITVSFCQLGTISIDQYCQSANRLGPAPQLLTSSKKKTYETGKGCY